MDSDGKWSAWFEQRFSCFDADDEEIDFEEFKKVLHIKEVNTGIRSLCIHTFIF